jgi:hypothetical protein
MLKNKCWLYVNISIRFFSIKICNLFIEVPSYKTARLNNDKIYSLTYLMVSLNNQ